MKILFNLTKVLLLTFMFSSCATTFIPKNQDITMKTGSSDAKVYIDNEKKGEGRTVNAEVSRGTVKDVVIVYGDEYLQKNEVLYPMQKRVGAYYPLQALNVPFILVYYGLAGIYADHKAIHTHKYPAVNSFEEEPIKKPVRGEDFKYTYLSNIKLNVEDADEKFSFHTGLLGSDGDINKAMIEAEKESIKEKEKQDKKDAKRKKKETEYLVDEDKDLNYDDLIFSNELKKALYNGNFIDTVNNVFTDNNNTLIIEGGIKDFDLFGISPNKRDNSGYISAARTDITWYIKNTYGEVLDSVSEKSFSEYFARPNYFKSGEEWTDYLVKVMQSSISQSFYSLLEKPAFIKVAKINNDFTPKFEATKLTKPSSVVVDKKDAAEASVIVKTESGHGSGFAITNDGYLLTNYHVLLNKETGKIPNTITIIDTDGKEWEGEFVKANKFQDIALLKVDRKFTKAFYCGDKKSFEKMQDIYTIGAPKSVSLGQSISTGLISNERKVNNNYLIQMNMSVNSGNSGGPIFDDNGTLHGVVVSKLVGKNVEGISFAIPGYKITEYLKLNY